MIRHRWSLRKPRRILPRALTLPHTRLLERFVLLIKSRIVRTSILESRSWSIKPRVRFRLTQPFLSKPSALLVDHSVLFEPTWYFRPRIVCKRPGARRLLPGVRPRIVCMRSGARRRLPGVRPSLLENLVHVPTILLHLTLEVAGGGCPSKPDFRFLH